MRQFVYSQDAAEILVWSMLNYTEEEPIMITTSPAEEITIGEVAAAIAGWKQASKPGGKRGLLQQLAKFQGIYVPSFYDVEYNLDQQISALRPLVQEAKPVIVKRVIKTWIK
jgi:nucleoside-diphosphate-sugar epimerase